MALAYIGLGSNLADPLEQVQTALHELANLPNTRFITCSSLYRSTPIGPEDQPDYINAVAKLESRLEPLVLLDALQAIEQTHGRERKVHWGARTLDLDILLYDQNILQTERLTVPHAFMHERGFVLAPLLEIEPTLALPSGETITSLWEACDQSGLTKLDPQAKRQTP